MSNFGDLLREYIERAGISDSELARSIGVRRQTIFRWKEGLTARPRNRDDVIALATKLRLSDLEQDSLLLAAGFAPENLEPLTPSSIAPLENDSPLATPPEPAVQEVRRPVGRLWIVLVPLILLLAAFAFWQSRPQPVPLPMAQPDETLLLVAPFQNFAGADLGFNLADRILEPLSGELDEGGIANARAALWPEPVRSGEEASDVLVKSGARLLVWGEYDSGRVVARLARSDPELEPLQVEAQVASPAELSATINSEVPEDVRFLVLITVGELYADARVYDQARAAFVQAIPLLPEDVESRTSLFLRLGLANQLGDSPDLDEAISFYSEVLNRDPDHDVATYNRGLAYLNRGRSGDLERALVDFERLLRRRPTDVPTLIGRGVVHFYLGNDKQAEADFSRVIDLDPERTRAYFNRGLLYIQQNKSLQWKADLERTVELAPDFADGHSALCWGYVLEAEAASALSHCHEAVERGAAYTLNSRGIAFAQLGRFENAQEDFRAFLDWLDTQPEASPYQRYRPLTSEWLAALETGINPIDDAVLSRLRTE